MTYGKGLIFYIVAFFLQPFLYNLFPGNIFTPNIILCVTVVFAFIYEDNYVALVWGALFGLLVDLCYGMYAGPSVLCVIATCALVWFIKKFINIENVINIVIVIVIASWAYATVYWGIYAIAGSTYGYLYAMKSILWQILFNTIISSILYLLLIRKVTKHRRDRYFR